MRKTLIILLLCTIQNFAQIIGGSAMSTLEAIPIADYAVILNETVNNSAPFKLRTGVRPLTIDSISATTGITLQAESDAISNANKFYTDTGDWTLHGSGSITRNADSSLTYSNIPQELNPNPNFDDWNYVDLFSAGTITSGWVVTGHNLVYNGTGALWAYTNVSSSSGVARTIKIRYTVNSVSGRFEIKEASGSSLIGTLELGTNEVVVTLGASKTLQIITWGATNTIDVDIEIISELIPPAGWIKFLTWNATNYCIEDDNGFKLVSDGTQMGIGLANALTIGKQYAYNITASNITTGSISLNDGVQLIVNVNSATTFTGTFTALGTSIILKRYSGATNGVISSLSITEVHDENYIALPYQPTQNQKHELSFDYEEGETDLLEGWDFTSGWATLGGASILDNNSFSSSGSGQGIWKAISFDNSKFYKVFIVSDGDFTVNTLKDGWVSRVQLLNSSGNLQFQPIDASYIYIRASSTTTVNVSELKLYELDSPTQSIESAKLLYTINNQTDSTNTVTTSYQTATKKFVGGSTDTLKISLSDTGKVKIKNPSLIKKNSWVVNRNDTLNIPYSLATDEAGSNSGIITAYTRTGNVTSDINWDVNNANELYASSRNFGTVTSPKLEHFTVQNLGTEDVTITGLSGLSAPYSFVSTVPITVPANSNNTLVYVQIAATTDGTHDDTAILTGTFENSPYEVDLTMVYEDISTPTDKPATIADLAFTDYTHAELGVDLNWSDASGAVRYIVYRSFDNSNYSIIGYTTTSDFTDNMPFEEVNTYYKVIGVSEEDVYSDFSNVVNQTIVPSVANLVYVNTNLGSGGTGTKLDPFGSANSLNTITLTSKDGIRFMSGTTNTISSTLFSNKTFDSDGSWRVATYGGTTKAILRTGSSYAGLLIDANTTQYLVLQNLNFISSSWIKFTSGSYNQVRGCDFSHYAQTPASYVSNNAFYLNSSSYNVIEWNTISGVVEMPTYDYYQDMIVLSKASNYNLIQYNKISESNHNQLSFYGDYNNYGWYDGASMYLSTSPHGNVVRRNHFYSTTHHNIADYTGAWGNLIEDNYFERAGTGLENSPDFNQADNTMGASIYANGYRSIYRFNIFKKSGHGENGDQVTAIDAQARKDYNNKPQNTWSISVYNNTFYDLFGGAIKSGKLLRADDPNTTINEFDLDLNYLKSVDNLYLNNSISNYGNLMDYHKWAIHIYSDWNTPQTTETWNNNHFGITSTDIIKYGDPSTANLNTLSYYYDYNQFGSINENLTYSGNLAGTSPSLFSPDATIGDRKFEELRGAFTPNESSPLIDNGGYLTKVNGNFTSQTTITLDRAEGLTDGNGIVEGDQIYIGSTSVQRTITDVDYDTEEITLNSAVTVNDNDNVWLVRQGEIPDIGAFPFKTTIVANPQLVSSSAIDKTESSLTIQSMFQLYDVDISLIQIQYSINDESLIEVSNTTPSSLSGRGSFNADLDIGGLEIGDVVNWKVYYVHENGSELSSLYSTTITTGGSGSTYGSNLVSNGEFETNIDGWTAYTQTATPTISQSSDQSYSGSYSLKVIAANTWDGVRSSTFATVTAGEVYLLRVAIYCSASEVVEIHDNNGYFGLDIHYTTTSGWNYLEYEITATGNGSESIVFGSYSGANTYYIDSFEMRLKN